MLFDLLQLLPSPNDLLGQVSDAIHLSRRTLAKIKQNLVWAFGYNVIAIPLAAGALLPVLGVCLTPSISGALMGMSSVMVVCNSLLLQREVQLDFAARTKTTRADSQRGGDDATKRQQPMKGFGRLSILDDDSRGSGGMLPAMGMAGSVSHLPLGAVSMDIVDQR